MSRTIRRTSGDRLDDWHYSSWKYMNGMRNLYYKGSTFTYSEFYDGKTSWPAPCEKAVAKAKALFHSDCWYKRSWQWPGPAVAEFIQRPYRRDAKHQLRKCLFDPDFEPIIRSKPKLPYWD